jgi:hypothetical protein
MLALAVIWKLPGAALMRQTAQDGTPTVRTKNVPIRKMREQPNNQKDPPTVGDALAIITPEKAA